MSKMFNAGNLITAELFTLTPTITAGLYSAGNSVGGGLTLSNVCLQKSPNNGGGLLVGLTVTDKGNQKAALTFLFYSKPLVATVTDNAAFIAATDLPNLVGRADVGATDYLTIGSDSKAVAEEKYSPGILLQNNETPATLNIYCICVTTGTPTYVSTSDLSFTFKFLPVF